MYLFTYPPPLNRYPVNAPVRPAVCPQPHSVYVMLLPSLYNIYSKPKISYNLVRLNWSNCVPKRLPLSSPFPPARLPSLPSSFPQTFNIKKGYQRRLPNPPDCPRPTRQQVVPHQERFDYIRGSLMTPFCLGHNIPHFNKNKCSH